MMMIFIVLGWVVHAGILVLHIMSMYTLNPRSFHPLLATAFQDKDVRTPLSKL